MILSTHFVTGAAVTSFTDNPVAIVTVPIILHFVLDIIPHREYLDDLGELKKKLPQLFTDIATGPIIIFLTVWLLYGLDFKVLFWFFLAGLAGVIPDGLTFLYLFFSKNKILKKFYAFHNYVQGLVLPEKSISWRNGFIFQILLDFIAVIFISLSKA